MKLSSLQGFLMAPSDVYEYWIHVSGTLGLGLGSLGSKQNYALFKK